MQSVLPVVGVSLAMGNRDDLLRLLEDGDDEGVRKALEHKRTDLDVESSDALTALWEQGRLLNLLLDLKLEASSESRASCLYFEQGVKVFLGCVWMESHVLILSSFFLPSALTASQSIVSTLPS